MVFNNFKCKTEVAKAKDTKKIQGQGQEQTLSRPRPRAEDTGASVLQKKSLQKIFSGDLKKKRSSKFFFKRKRSSKIFFQAIST